MIEATYDVRQPTIMIWLGETIHRDALVYLGRSATASLRTKHREGMADQKTIAENKMSLRNTRLDILTDAGIVHLACLADQDLKKFHMNPVDDPMPNTRS
jgi:hypothetical protein